MTIGGPPVQPRITVNSDSLDRWCLKALVDLGRLSPRLPQWPGPAREWLENRPDKHKLLVNVCQRFPKCYAERLLFTHAIHLAVSRAVFPWNRRFAEDLLYFESVLHLEPDECFYRDHYIHALEVGCVGEQLLAEVEIDGRTLQQILLASFRSIVSRDSTSIAGKYAGDCGMEGGDLADERGLRWLRTAWWLTALFHDIGYFAQKSGRLFGSRMERTFGSRSNRLLEAVGREEFERNLVWRQLNRWREGVDVFRSFDADQLFALMIEKDHPGVGAVAIASLSHRLPPYTTLSPQEFSAFQLAAHAILCHDHTGLASYMRELRDPRAKDERPLFHLEYKENPLAALLIVCDHISEFHREKLEPVHDGGDDSVALSARQEWDRVEIDVAGHELSIRFVAKHDIREDTLKHFIKDKKWFLRRSTPSPGDDPYLRLDDAPFSVQVEAVHGSGTGVEA